MKFHPDFTADRSFLSADPAMILEAIQAKADMVYEAKMLDKTPSNHKAFRRTYINHVYNKF